MRDEFDTKTLISQILAGDVKKFARIIDDNKRLVAHIVYKMIPNKTDGEDVCQDIFMKIYTRLDTFKFDSKLSTWIGRIAYNHCLNQLEKKKVLLYDDLSADDNFIEVVETGLPLPDEIASQNDISSILEKEISQLPRQYRTIITLYHMEEMTYEEIAQITGLPDGTVKSHLFRARKLLKERLSAGYRQEDLCH